jgi:beta-galactosidase
MKKLSFNENWTVRPLSREGEAISVTLPHDAMRTEQRVPSSLGEGNIGYFEGGDYEYKKRFTIPAKLRDKRLTLEFESVYHNAEVYLNGEKVMMRPYGYTNFYVDLNGRIEPDGENEIAVIARNADQPNSRWYPGTGIYRPVWLYAYESKHILINGVRIETLSTDPAVVRFGVKTTDPGKIEIDICHEGNSVLTATADADINGNASIDLIVPDAKLWSVGHPNLYTAKIKFENDERTETFGIRTLAWTPDKGIAVNGKRVVLRGACIHHDNGILGACTYPEVEERRVRILKEAGYNAVRSAHNPASKYLLDACDKLGMLMMDEYVDCWYMHKTDHDYASCVTDWWQKDLKDMVEKDFNHPCVIMYSTGNEVAESAQEKGIKLQQDFTDYLHKLDPTRPVTCGINIFFNFLSSIGMGVYSDEKAQKQAEQAKKAAEQAAAKKPKKKAVGSEFFNKIAAAIGTDFMKFGATLPPCDWKTRDVFAAMDIAGYNYGNWRYKRDANKYPSRLILGSETLIGDAYDFWEIAKKTSRVVGDFVWAAWDYIGECGDNSPEFAAYKSEDVEDRVRGGTCRIDMTGRLTPEADYTKVAFEQAEGPFLAVNPPCYKDKPPLTGWQLTRAQRSWTYPGSEGDKVAVEVYARAATVELYINGEKVGRKRVKKCIAKFKTIYKAGEITAIAYDKNRREVGSDTLKTASEETVLRLEPEVKECKSGEMVYFRIRYTDKNGELKPLERHTVSVRAENGVVMGAANGCCYFKGNFAQPQTPTYLGEAQTIVQATGAGLLRVYATDGDSTVSAEVVCKE